MPVHGRLERFDGVPVLTLWGSVEERGHAEGYLLADEIIALVRDFALSKRVVPHPVLWDTTLLPRVRQVVTVPDIVRRRYDAIVSGIAARRADQGMVKELNRALTTDDLIAFATIPDLRGLLCSSFAAWGDSVEDAGGEGRILVGRNLDYFATEELTRHTMLIVNAPHGDRRGWVSVGWPGVHGCVSGVSDAGVLVAIHDVHVIARGGKRFTPRLIALTELIERLGPASTKQSPGSLPERARDLLREMRYGMGGNVMLAWTPPSGKPGAAVIELDGRSWVDGGVSLRGPDPGQHSIACSNHHRLRGEDTRGCTRYRKICAGLEASRENPLDFDDAWALITRARARNTVYRFVIDLTRGQIRLGRREKPRGKTWHEARLSFRRLLAKASEVSNPRKPSSKQSFRQQEPVR